MGQTTPLFEQHQSSGARIVDFGGWDMPLHYGSQVEEHHKVRQDVGMFDVSHMTLLDIKGASATDFLSYLLANNIGKLKEPGKALYSCMLNEQGGVIDDLIVYYFTHDCFKMVVNAATRDKDIAWIYAQSQSFDVTITELTELGMIALQGPNAQKNLIPELPASLTASVSELKPFTAVEKDNWFIARTGYTGEDGYEMILPHELLITLWQNLVKKGVQPCGLGARDTLRLEAGMHLYGNDMDETTSPLDCGLGWTIALDPPERNFIGRQVLEQYKTNGVQTKLIGLIMKQRGVLRQHQKLYIREASIGEISSGGFSPTLGHAIALARIDKQIDQSHCNVEIRGKMIDCEIVKPSFVRNGQSCIKSMI